MADLDMIFKVAKYLTYEGHGKWQAQCPVKGCEKNSLSITQTNMYLRTDSKQSVSYGDVACANGCSRGEIIEAFKFHPEQVFMNDKAFESDPENYQCLLNEDESVALITEELKYLLAFLESPDAEAVSARDNERFWMVAFGLRWYLTGMIYMRGRIIEDDVSSSKDESAVNQNFEGCFDE